MAKKLEALLRGDIKRLIVLEPPRHGKSEQVSRLFPAWALANNPDEQIIACSYNDMTAKDFNLDVQRIMMKEEYKRFFPASILNDGRDTSVEARSYKRNASVFEMVGRKGAYRAAGIGGAITGKGATIGIIDDPFKNWEEAYSDAYRKRVWDWYTSTFITRGEGQFSTGGDVRIVICVTPWHVDDLVGRLLAKSREDPRADQWELVILPALLDVPAQGGDIRDMGEALWPAKYPVKLLDNLKVNVGPLKWESLYQCRPTQPGGGMFKHDYFKRYKRDDLPHCRFQFLSCDMTFKETTSGSFVVFQCWGMHEGNYYLIDQVRFRGDFVRTLKEFLDFVQKYPRAHGKLIEDKANGPAIISALSDKIPGILPIKPEGSKEARGAAVSAIVASGNVYLPEEVWVDEEFLPEVTSFPNGKYDDQVDCMTQALSHGSESPIIKMQQLVQL